MTDAAEVQYETISIVDAGRLLGLGRDAAYLAAHNGQIPVLRLGRRLRVPRAALMKLLEEPARQSGGQAA